MKEDIIYGIQNQFGAKRTIKIVPETEPKTNTGICITGAFHLFYMMMNANLPPAPMEMDTYMCFAGSLCFMDDAFHDWHYDGKTFAEAEIDQIVKIIQDNVKEWLDQGDIPLILEE